MKNLSEFLNESMIKEAFFQKMKTSIMKKINKNNVINAGTIIVKSYNDSYDDSGYNPDMISSDITKPVEEVKDIIDRIITKTTNVTNQNSDQYISVYNIAENDPAQLNDLYSKISKAIQKECKSLKYVKKVDIVDGAYRASKFTTDLKEINIEIEIDNGYSISIVVTVYINDSTYIY